MNESEKIFSQAVELLKKGDVVAFATETVYGLGARVFCEEAVRKIFLIKQRPSDNPLIAHICQLQDVERLALEIPKNFYALAERFWPGPLTMVLRKRPEVPSIVSAGHPTIAIRIPSHPLALRLIQEVGEPLVAPSANVSGRPSPTNASDVREDLGDLIPLILDGDECLIGIESTVIDLTRENPVILRPGAITKEALEEVLQTSLRLATEKDPIHSPGMKYRHYAPKAKIHLALHLKNLPEKAPYLLSSVEMPSAIVFNRRNFYAHLRLADRMKVPEITIYCDPKMQEDIGLMNRIFRSAG